MNAENLKKAREKAGYTQAQAAEAIGVSDGTYKNYEQGKREPNGEKMVTIANLFGVTTDYLLGRPEAPEPPKNPIQEASQKERVALEKWLSLDGEKREAVLHVMQSIIDAYEMAGENPIRIKIVKKSRYRTSAGIGYDLNDADAWENVQVEDCSMAQKADFIVEIDGDSMEPTYCNGENVFVKATPDVEIGKIGIFIVDGKGYIKERGVDCLISHNKKYHPIMLEGTENRCVGSVLGVADVVEN